MKEQLFRWFDAHELTSDEISDFDYLYNLLENFEEEVGELSEFEAIELILDYQWIKIK